MDLAVYLSRQNFYKMKIKLKKAQEEIVGFVVIVVLVSIVLVIILSISLTNKNDVDKKSNELLSFLKSLRVVTTECASYGDNYLNIGQLMHECFNNKQCSSKEDSCIVLNRTLKNILNTSFYAYPKALRKGYIFKATYSNNFTSSQKEIAGISEGNCSGDYLIAEDFIIERPGSIRFSLQECY